MVKRLLLGTFLAGMSISSYGANSDLENQLNLIEERNSNNETNRNTMILKDNSQESIETYFCENLHKFFDKPNIAGTEYKIESTPINVKITPAVDKLIVQLNDLDEPEYKLTFHSIYLNRDFKPDYIYGTSNEWKETPEQAYDQGTYPILMLQESNSEALITEFLFDYSRLPDNFPLEEIMKQMLDEQNFSVTQFYLTTNCQE